MSHAAGYMFWWLSSSDNCGFALLHHAWATCKTCTVTDSSSDWQPAAGRVHPSSFLCSVQLFWEESAAALLQHTYVVYIRYWVKQLRNVVAWSFGEIVHIPAWEEVVLGGVEVPRECRTYAHILPHSCEVRVRFEFSRWGRCWVRRRASEKCLASAAPPQREENNGRTELKERKWAGRELLAFLPPTNRGTGNWSADGKEVKVQFDTLPNKFTLLPGVEGTLSHCSFVFSSLHSLK